MTHFRGATVAPKFPAAMPLITARIELDILALPESGNRATVDTRSNTKLNAAQPRRPQRTQPSVMTVVMGNQGCICPSRTSPKSIFLRLIFGALTIFSVLLVFSSLCHQSCHFFFLLDFLYSTPCIQCVSFTAGAKRQRGVQRKE